MYILSGTLIVLAVVAVVLCNRHSSEPQNGFGDYVFRDDLPFDLNLFPSIVLPADVEQLKILQLADPQIKLGFAPHRDRKTLKLIRRAVEREHPDLCVVTGDLACSVFTHAAIKNFAKFMLKLGVKWAYVFGNHDAEHGCSKYAISQLLHKYGNCLFSVGASNVNGAGNYMVNVYKGEKTAQNLVYSLFMLDSGMYAHTGGKINKNRYNCVRQSQIQWYTWAVKGLQKMNPAIQSTMFFHIPTKQFANMYYLNELQLGHNLSDSVKKLLPNVQITNVRGTVCENSKNKSALVSDDSEFTVGIYYQGREEGQMDDIFAQVKKLGCTKAIFCGHDHVNTLKGYYDGVYLGYGLCCGYHTYPLFNKFPGKNVVFNGALWVDELGRKMNKGMTLINVSLVDNYGALHVVDKQADELR